MSRNQKSSAYQGQNSREILHEKRYLYSSIPANSIVDSGEYLVEVVCYVTQDYIPSCVID